MTEHVRPGHPRFVIGLVGEPELWKDVSNERVLIVSVLMKETKESEGYEGL